LFIVDPERLVTLPLAEEKENTPLAQVELLLP
jgi:hypothetical protein